MRSAIYITAILFLIVPSFAQSKYIGYTYTGVSPNEVLPNGVVHLGGGILGDINARHPIGVSEVQLGSTRMLWLERAVRRDKVDGITWRVIDVLSFSNFGNADYLVSGDFGECTDYGREIPNLVGIGKINNKTGRIKPIRLWLANLKTGRFVKTSIAGVKCIEPST